METTFIARGVSPTGRTVEVSVIAPSAEDARKRAEEAGLARVVVEKSPPEAEEKRTGPSSAG